MRIEIAAFTRAGAAQAVRLCEALSASGDEVRAWVSARNACEGLPVFARALDWTREHFAEADALVFIGATGIAVRSIAPWLASKLSDPAVVCMDERGAYVISLISGHVGGANRLARRIASVTGGQAVVSTATDVNGLFSVDDWIARNGMALVNAHAVRAFAGALLDGETVGIVSETPIDGALPRRTELRGYGPVGLCIGVHEARPFDETVFAVPRSVTLGIGCRRGTSEERIRAAVEQALSEAHVRPESVCAVASIDLKKDEAGLLTYCRSIGVDCSFYTADRLKEITLAEGTLSHSEFVQRITGVDNVCERAALTGGGALIYGKHAFDGVTVAMAEKQIRITFEGE